MNLYDLIPEEYITEACWKGYKQVGMKKKGTKMVPNCVPINEEDEISETLTYHINHGVGVDMNIHRPGSEAFF